MALSVNRLGDAILAAIDGVSDKTDRQALFRAMAAAIISEIQNFAQVTVNNGTLGGVSAGAGTTTGPWTGVTGAVS
jgi:hypothetical protein